MLFCDITMWGNAIMTILQQLTKITTINVLDMLFATQNDGHDVWNNQYCGIRLHLLTHQILTQLATNYGQ
jgi:hypothetical protein